MFHGVRRYQREQHAKNNNLYTEERLKFLKGALIITSYKKKKKKDAYHKVKLLSEPPIH